MMSNNYSEERGTARTGSACCEPQSESAQDSGGSCCEPQSESAQGSGGSCCEPQESGGQTQDCCASEGFEDTYGKALPRAEQAFTTEEGKRRKRESLWSQGYTDDDLKGIPDSVLATTFGSGNPLALGEIEPGSVVVDIGSGAGLDSMIAAQRVGPRGTVYGIDPSPRMLDRSRQNTRDMDLHNVHFLEGSAEKIPLPDGTADVVLSNCVLSCLTVGESAFKEAIRILKPGGWLHVTDVVPKQGEAGRLLDPPTYRKRLVEAGFTEVEVTPSRIGVGSDEPCCPDGQPTVRVKARRPATT